MARSCSCCSCCILNCEDRSMEAETPPCFGLRNWDAAERDFNHREESGLMDVVSTILLVIDKISINKASGRESMDKHVK